MRRIAEERFGWTTLKPGQEEAIEELVGGRDVLVVMPTGYGKSAVYQVAAHLLDGPTVVISPLIALQADQVRHLDRAGGEGTAVAVNSAHSDGANARAWESVAAGDAEFVFLAPEQLARQEVVDELAALDVGLVVVDEAHCVSSWGHDFRPDYLRLGAAIDALGRPPVVALTATGSAPVRDEIVERLGLRAPRVLVGGFDRPNIHLSVVRHEDADAKRRAVVETTLDAAKPGLVYVATRADTERFAEELRQSGLRAAAYHGGLGARARRDVHEAFLAGELDVVVATSAFGMGVDKPDVRFVVHGDITESLDAYVQEVGRSGRDGRPASATLHYRAEDLGLRAFFASGRPKAERVRAVAAALAAADGRRTARTLADELDLPTRSVTMILNLLVEADAATSDDQGFTLRGPVDPGHAVDVVDEAVDRRRRVDESRRAMVRRYAETSRCRRAFVVEYFGAEVPEPCGNCDTCDRGSAFEEAEPEVAGEYRLDQSVRHREWGDGRVMSVESDRLTVFFEEEGYRVLSLEAVREGDLLTAS
ncbi:RecQ family ATP-dependent DNA helicase [Agromyces indicus]|uniref:ATP-dependent DNA helicase RecQ n=1 Tax=Agromyces indicus TaxID=758919 RepID=A0ABU1FKP6_9MICO|nr:RecQ family ATP-dependent DNA helicase [Agromyces indicus]MDR5692326.1 RecQ family ATP-dependent DNA helicase [Agromyces indicus]